MEDARVDGLQGVGTLPEPLSCPNPDARSSNPLHDPEFQRSLRCLPTAFVA